MKTERYLLPGWTLAPLFNGDLTGTTDEEDRALDDFLERENLGFALNYEFDGFHMSNDLDRLGDDCYLVTLEKRN